MSEAACGNYERARLPLRAREAAPVRVGEIEIQARLFAGEFGTRWTTSAGVEIEVVHFGEWNREAGPDFRAARLRFADGTERDGDIEVDTDPRDWENHGHARNPAYAGVVLQLYVESGGPVAFARTFENREVLQARLELTPSPSHVLKHLPGTVEPDVARAMIEAAADFRLRQKVRSRAQAVSLHGADGALFFAIATGMGYKNNSIPFLLVAQRTGLRIAASPSGNARLFGLAGFLEPRTFDAADDVTRDYLKPLWEEWWAIRDQMARLVLPVSMWRLSGLRPANHPHRRLGALGATARQFDTLRAKIKKNGIEGFEEFFLSLGDDYWTHHWNLSASRLDRDLALVGADRVRDLAINAFTPGLPMEDARAALETLRGPTASGKITRACEWLVGKIDSKLTRSALHQQGLIQLYNDFGFLSPLEAWGKIRSDA